MSRKPAQDVDYLRVYPGLNDFSDALEAIPLELVRHFTLLKEIDAKCTTTAPRLSQAISRFLKMDFEAAGREDELAQVRQLLQELMPCLEEKMHVASMAADVMARHVQRVDADFQLIVDHEIPKHIQIDADNPAVSDEVRPVEKPSATRSETRREALAARKAAAAAAAAAASTDTQTSRAGTPAAGANGAGLANGVVGNGSARGKSRAGAGAGYGDGANGHANANGHAAGANGHAAAAAHGVGAAYERERGAASGGSKRRRDEDDYDSEDVKVVAPSRRRGGAEKNEPVYCYCGQGSYGDMVGCDGPDCKREWFHLGCIGLSASPKGQWFCEDCQAKLRTRR